MAIVPKFFVVATQYPVNASATIKEGQLLKLNNSGEAILFNGSGIVVGVAGDNKQTGASSMPGVSAGWQNRVNDSFNETRASGEITVYQNGGEFGTDQYESDVLTAVTGTALYASAHGLLTTVSSGSVVAVLTRAAGPYPSGVPGTDINGDMALAGDNNNQYIEFKLIA